MDNGREKCMNMNDVDTTDYAEILSFKKLQCRMLIVLDQNDILDLWFYLLECPIISVVFI